jgi:hypothetical protein
MKDIINPKIYGLSSRVQLREIEEGWLAIVKKRKSRIIMKDALQILEIASQIRKTQAELEIAVIISGPICSKSIAFLKDNQIDIICE